MTRSRIWTQVAGMLIACLVLCACGQNSVLDVDCSTFHQHQHLGKDVFVAAGESFSVTLCSNPSTGYQWGETQISDTSVLVQVDRQYKAPGGIRPPAPGAPGEETWTFRASGPGRATVQLQYGQPWEGGMRAVWTIVLTVVVD